MLLDKEFALDCSNKKQVISSENRNKHILNVDTDATVYQYRIDGSKAKEKPKPVYSVGSTVKKCDFIVEVTFHESKGRLYIIELKGSDLDKAILQIQSTIDLFKTDKEVFSGYDSNKYDSTNNVNNNKIKYEMIRNGPMQKITEVDQEKEETFNNEDPKFYDEYDEQYVK